MRKLFLCVAVALCAHLAHPQSESAAPHPEPVVIVDNIALAHEHRGWRVVNVSTPLHANLFTRFNLLKGDLIIRIDGKNAAETGPMQMASLLNQGDRQRINLFLERGIFSMETVLRDILQEDYDPVGADPFKSVTAGFSVPDAEFKDINGQPVALEQFKGKWLLIDFMATWCAPCMEKLPNVLNVADHHQLSLLTIALNDKMEAVQHMRQSYKIDSPIAMAHILSQLPIDFGVATNRWTAQIPALILIRPDGEIALIDIGGLDGDQIEKVIPCVMTCKADKALSLR
jgi:thiol-disulfide isomerase/thioredoxin